MKSRSEPIRHKSGAEFVIQFQATRAGPLCLVEKSARKQSNWTRAPEEAEGWTLDHVGPRGSHEDLAFYFNDHGKPLENIGQKGTAILIESSGCHKLREREKSGKMRKEAVKVVQVRRDSGLPHIGSSK